MSGDNRGVPSWAELFVSQDETEHPKVNGPCHVMSIEEMKKQGFLQAALEAEHSKKYTQGPTAGVGIGGAPTRASTLAESPTERKQQPIASGVLDYFPDALVAIAHVSWQGNEQHNPGQPLHWNRAKSQDEADALMRHFMQRGSMDTDGIAHSAKMAWRALALLQKEIEAQKHKRPRT